MLIIINIINIIAIFHYKIWMANFRNMTPNNDKYLFIFVKNCFSLKEIFSFYFFNIFFIYETVLEIHN